MRRFRHAVVTAVALMALAGCSPGLGAAPYLVASWPARDARLSVAPHIVELTFNHALRADASGVEVSSVEGGVVLGTSSTVDPADARRLQVRIHEPIAGAFDVRWHAVGADSGAASQGRLRLTFQDGSSSPPRVDVSPGTAESGERLELVGKGFAQNSPVSLTIGDDARPLANTQADDAGKFNLEARVPTSVPLGVQPVTAIDAESHTAMGSVEVRWGGWPPLVATDVGEAGPEAGEVTFSVTARNLSDYVLEHVRVVLQDPDGGVLVRADPGAQRVDGALEWRISVLDRGVTGPFRATYRSSGRLVSHAWLEFRHRAERGCAGGTCLPAFISTNTSESAPVAPAR